MPKSPDRINPPTRLSRQEAESTVGRIEAILRQGVIKNRSLMPAYEPKVEKVIIGDICPPPKDAY